MTLRILALIVWSGALVALFGATIVEPNVMGIGGLVAAVAAIAWGLAAALDDERPNLAEYRDAVWARRDQEAAEDELPYLPIDQGEVVFDHETDAWRRDVASMNEMERAIASEGAYELGGLGVVGDREDERYG